MREILKKEQGETNKSCYSRIAGFSYQKLKLKAARGSQLCLLCYVRLYECTGTPAVNIHLFIAIKPGVVRLFPVIGLDYVPAMAQNLRFLSTTFHLSHQTDSLPMFNLRRHLNPR